MRRTRRAGSDGHAIDGAFSTWRWATPRASQSSLGGADRRKLDEYLYAVRDIEKRIQSAERDQRRARARSTRPSASVPDDFAEHSQLMFDLMALAFQTDMTRVITVLLAIEQSPRNYPEIGITEGHHGLTHHQGDKAKIEKVTQINEYHIKQFTYLLDKFKSTRDGDGTLLDNSMIVYGSGLADGNQHQHDNLPAVLAGRGRGTIRPGRHVRYADETPMAESVPLDARPHGGPGGLVGRQHRPARRAFGSLMRSALLRPFAEEAPVRARYRVQVLDRSFQILDALSSAKDTLSPAELAGDLRLHKSTIHRLLVVLEGQRFIRRTADGKYGLGTKLIEMGSRAMEQLDLSEHAVPFLRRLVEETGETAHISVLSGTEMMSIANVPGKWTLTMPSTVGRRTQMYCTSVGKAFLAFLPDDRLDALVQRLQFTPHTRRTITSASALAIELARIRRRGYAVDNEEVEDGLRCIGAPVRDYTGEVIASLGIAGPVFRVQKSRIVALSRAVMKAADSLSADLGYVRASTLRKKDVVPGRRAT